jgi:antitoxin PrlF
MTITTLTNSGQVIIPANIIEWLNLQPGDLVDIAIAPDGKVYLQPAQPAQIDVRELSGILYQAGREAVSLSEMEAAISECAGESIYLKALIKIGIARN